MKTSYGAKEWVLVFLLAGIWGSSFILMKRGLEVFEPAQVAAIRMFTAFLCLFPLVAKNIPSIDPKKWKFLVASAVFGNGIPALLFCLAQTKINSSVAGILNSLTPLFALLIGVFFFRHTLVRLHLLGVVLGFLGAVIILVFKPNGNFEGQYSYGFLLVVATAMYGLSVNIIKKNLQEMRPLWISGFAVSISGIPYGIYLFTTDFTQRVSTVPGAWTSLMYVGILGVVGTAISLVLFNKLIKTTSVLFASSVTYLIPVIALVWGFVDNERLGMMQLSGLAAILAGVYLVNRH